MGKIYIFDICGTLFQSNTTFDFLNFFLSDDKGYQRFKKIYKTLIWRILNKIIKRIFYCDLTRILAVKYLKGYHKDELLKAANNFYENLLSTKKNTIIHNELNEKLNDKTSTVILASATLDFIAETIAQKLNCPTFYSTSLIYDNKGYCKGSIKDDLLGRKLKKLSGKYQRPFEEVYTDDISDISLLINSQKQYIISYPKTIYRWKKIIKRHQWHAKLIEY